MEGDRLEGLDIRELTSGYGERMRRLALFDPLAELDRRNEVDAEDKKIDFKGFGLLTLLFFFEQKLMRQSQAGVKELAAFLQAVSHDQYRLSQDRYQDLARKLIQTFRPTHGKKRSYQYFDWETKQEITIDYSILKANNFDIETNTQYYSLDDDGLELVFATKEFYSEFQLSINQLILRKQLEKGEFKGALRQINEMKIDVEALSERMIKLKHEIQRSIVSDETYKRYKQLLEDIYSRLEREDLEFKELTQFVSETKARLFSRDVHLKEEKTYRFVVRITKELEEVHSDHSSLLDQVVLLNNTTLKVAHESLYYSGVQSFNFDHDLVAKIISDPLPLAAMEGILHPFLKVEENRSWSLLTVFDDQNIREENENSDHQEFLIARSETQDLYFKVMHQKYQELMELLLLASENNECSSLSEFMSYLQKINRAEIYEQRYFYDFWLILHQRSPIVRGKGSNIPTDDQLSYENIFGLIGDRTLEVIEGDSVLEISEQFSIQEMYLKLEGESY